MFIWVDRNQQRTFNVLRCPLVRICSRCWSRWKVSALQSIVRQKSFSSKVFYFIFYFLQYSNSSGHHYQEGAAAKRGLSKWGSWLAVRGFELLIFTFKCHELGHFATTGPINIRGTVSNNPILRDKDGGGNYLAHYNLGSARTKWNLPHQTLSANLSATKQGNIKLKIPGKPFMLSINFPNIRYKTVSMRWIYHPTLR